MLHERIGALRRERENLQREIDAAIAGHCAEEAIGDLLQDGAAAIEPRREQLEKRRQACEAQVKQRFENRGQLNEQLKALAEDRTPGVKQLELAMVEKRLAQAIARWHVLAVTHRALENVRKTYEHTRQPETLQEASGYFKRLTQDRYHRVWTPLSGNILLVDGPEERALGVEVLSRGAREQLFLSLRLALASSYARRGAELPLLLDDVLVNFDIQRAKAAAAVLRDYAAGGHQLFVFTCHEHISQLFESLKVEVTRLPENTEPSTTVSLVPKASRKRGKRKPPPEREPYEVVAEEEAVAEQAALAEQAGQLVTPLPAAQAGEEEAEGNGEEELAPWEEDEVVDTDEPFDEDESEADEDEAFAGDEAQTHFTDESSDAAGSNAA